MTVLASINVHLEHDKVDVKAVDLPEHGIAYLVLSQGASYGELNIFFPYGALAQVQEIARLIEVATTQIKEPKASEPAEEEVVF